MTKIKLIYCITYVMKMLKDSTAFQIIKYNLVAKGYLTSSNWPTERGRSKRKIDY